MTDTATTMTDLRSQLHLMAWLSPAFPTGAFAYSHGLETAVADNVVRDADSLADWLTNLLRHGAGWNDAVLLAEAWRCEAGSERLAQVGQLAEAMSACAERHLETMAQGKAFMRAAQAWEPEGDAMELTKIALPVAVGKTAARHGLELRATVAAYLHAYVSNQIQAALRLMKLGQQSGVEILAGLEPEIIDTADAASASTLDDLGSAAFAADIASMRHETLQPRIFRS